MSRREIYAAMSNPLQWPPHVRRAKERKASLFGKSYYNKRSVPEARDLVLLEMTRFGADQVLITTDAPINADGWTLTANRRAPDDPGMAVYFDLEDIRQAIAIDVYDKPGCNLWAIGRTIEALRQIERDGGPSVMRAAVSGFRALPAAGETSGASWWEVLELAPDANGEQIRKAYKRLARKYHPDNKQTCDRAMFQAVQVAMRQGLAAREGRVD